MLFILIEDIVTSIKKNQFTMEIERVTCIWMFVYAMNFELQEITKNWSFGLFRIKLPQLAGMENWNQDHPERYSNFCRLFTKFQGDGKWPWTWWGRRKRQGHWPSPPGHQKWRKACINICKHILKFSNCVLVRVPINNNNYEQPIALFVIILAKNTFTNHHG